MILSYHVFWGICAFVPWLYYNRPSRSFPTVKAFFTALRASTTLPVGAAGFCWGGKHTLLLSHKTNFTEQGRPLIDAGFTGHPSMVDFPSDIDKIAVPMSFALPEKDHQIKVPEQSNVLSEIVVNGKPEGLEGEVKVYARCGHGFCVRADVMTKDSDDAEQSLEAQDQAIGWFDKKLAGN